MGDSRFIKKKKKIIKVKGERHTLTHRKIETYFLLEEAYTIWTHSEAGDAWSSQVPGILLI
jgi:hypothetical protein